MMKTPATATALTLLSLVVAACGGGGDGDTADPTTSTTAATTTTATTAPTTTTATTQPTTTTTQPATTTTAASLDPLEITVVADNVAFDTDRITAKVGQEITVTLNNRDSTSDEGHNIHFLVGEQDFFTPIELAPSTDSVTFTVDTPGEYSFICDTHVVEMIGTLVVEDG